MLNMLRLAVGARDVEHLREWQLDRETLSLPGINEPAVYTTTRMVPSRAAELIQGGSLYWVVKGQIKVRQEFLHIDTVEGEGDRPLARLVLRQHWVLTVPTTCRPFQGWRYFPAAHAPADLGSAAADEPTEMLNELRALGLI